MTKKIVESLWQLNSMPYVREWHVSLSVVLKFYRTTLDAMLARYICCLRVSVRLSVCKNYTMCRKVNRYGIETTGRIQLFFLSWRLPSTYHTLCYKGIWVYISPNARVLPSGSPDIRKIPPRQVDRVWRVVNKTRHRRRLVDGRACWRHLYDSRWVVAVYYKRSTVIAPIRRLDVRILL